MTSDPDVDDTGWLIGPEAAEVLDQLAANTSSMVADAKRLQRCYSPARARLLMNQVKLRRKAAAKFPDAGQMFFFAQALEQATDLYVARYKARRFPSGERVADLCCGIGGDSIGLAERGPITAVDYDRATILLAEANLRILNSTEWNLANEFRTDDVARFSVDSFAAWHLDPDRRASGRRTTQLTSYAPGMETIERLLAERSEAAVKLAPATVVPEAWQEQAELEWIGRDRQCRQQVAWFGGLAQSPGFRRATVLRTLGNSLPRVSSFVGQADIRPPVADQIGRYLLEPDASVLAARLDGALAESHGLAAIHPSVPYFTADESVDDPILQCFEVTDVLPFDRKRVRRLFHERGVGRLEIKTRGIEDRPERIRRELRLRGNGEAVLLVARFGKQVTAIVARRAR